MNRNHKLLLLIIFFTASVMALFRGPDPVDDAYITFRYARNIISGMGMVYNSNERVLGTTTPLFTLILAAGGLILGSTWIPSFAWLISGFSHALGTVFLFLIAEKAFKNRLTNISLAFLYAASPEALIFIRGGMESSFFTLFLLISSWALLEDKIKIACSFGSLSLLARPEGALWLSLMLLWSIFHISWILKSGQGSPTIHNFPCPPQRGRRVMILILQGFLPTLIILLPWLIFSLFYYGSPIPHSITAKRLAYYWLNQQAPFFALNEFVHYLNWRWWGWITFFKLEPNILSTLGVLLALGICLLGMYRLAKINRNFLPLTLYPFLHISFISIGNPLVFGWYFVPLLPGMGLMLTASLGGLNDYLISPPEPGSETEKKKNWILASTRMTYLLLKKDFRKIITAFLLTAMGLFYFPDKSDSARGWFSKYTIGTTREKIYIQMVSHLLENKKSSPEVLAAPEIGAAGWVWHGKILDTVGLVSPETLPYLPPPVHEITTPYAIPQKLIRELKPKYILSLEIFMRNSLFRDPDFIQNYHPLLKVPYNLWGSDGIYLLEKKSE